MSDVQEVRYRIIQLAREIEDYSKANVPPRTFFHEFLRRVVGAVGARAGVVWLRNGANRIELFCDHNLSRTTFNDNPNATRINHQIVAEVMSNGQACTYHPGETDVELPTEDMLVLAALQQNKEVVGVIQIFQRNDTPPAARPGFLQFVEQMTGYACRYLDTQATRDQPEETGESVAVSKVAEDFEQFVLQLHKTLDFKEVAFTAANDGRLLVGCDRMSVAVMDGRKAVIRAISGQERVNQRANLVRRMTKLAARVVATKETMEYTGKVDHLAPKVEKALADFIQESGSRMVTVIPVFQPDALVEKEDESKRPKEKVLKVVGGLIVEQVAESQPKPGVLEKAQLIGDHVGSAVYNAKTHHRLFLMPLWKLLGKCFGFFEGRNALKAAAVLVLIAALVASMVLIPWEYRVEGTGVMTPFTQKEVFAPWNGTVTKVLAVSGKHVEAGELLIVLEDKPLKAEYSAAEGELTTKRALERTLKVELGNVATGRVQGQGRSVDEIAGQLEQTMTEVAALTKKVAILRERVDQLQVRAPISGTVATFQLDTLLNDRPVNRGEVLLEIKDETGPWRLELEVEEQRMGHLLDAQAARDLEELPIEFVLATDAEATFEGNLSLVDTRVNSSEEAGSVVMVFATFDKEQLPRQPRIGADVRAKISCTDMSLGYVLFGDVVEFVQKYFWL